MKLFNVATSNILLLRRDKTSMTQSSKPAEEPEPPPWRLAETSTKFTKIAQPKTHGNWTFMIVKRWMHHNQRPTRRGKIENPRRCSEKRERVERDSHGSEKWEWDETKRGERKRRGPTNSICCRLIGCSLTAIDRCYFYFIPRENV